MTTERIMAAARAIAKVYGRDRDTEATARAALAAADRIEAAEAGPSGRAPRTIYWVDLITIGKLGYRQKGGGKYTDRAMAEAHIDSLARSGISAALFEGTVTWKKCSATE